MQFDKKPPKKILSKKLFHKYFLHTNIIFLLQTFFLFPQTPPYHHYTTNDGLASSTVFDIIQDDTGFMWFGTLNGLNKFDGKKFITYRENAGLNSNVITHLLKGGDGEIYASNYEKGINILRNEKIENYITEIDGKKLSINYMIQHKQNIYAYKDYGLIYNITKKSIVSFGPPRRSFWINRIKNTHDNNLIVLTAEGLFNLDDDNLTKLNIKGLPDSEYFDLTYWNDGTIFIAGKGIIYRIKNNVIIKKYDVSFFDNKQVYLIFSDNRNNIWFSILNKGFFLIPNNSDKIINMGIKLGLENTQIDNFFQDREGNIWIATFGKGVYCLNNPYITNYTEDNGLTNNNVTAISKFKNDKILIGTRNGINILENGIIDKVKDNSGRILTGYVNEINSFEDIIYSNMITEISYVKIFYKEMNFQSMPAPSFYKTQDGKYIFGDMGNIIYVKRNFSYEMIPNEQELAVIGDKQIYNRVNVIFEDSKKNIWAGTSLGLGKFSKTNTSTWDKTLFLNDPVMSSKINSIFQDSKNNVWFTGVKGIARYNIDDNSIASYSKILGFELSTPTSVAEDNKNRLWIGTMGGLFLWENNSIKYLNNNTGLLSDEILSLFFDKQENILYVGTSNGLSLLDLNLFDTYEYNPPSTIINSIKAGDSIYTSLKKELFFEPEQNNILINFKAFCYSFPGTVKYKYKLNDKWVETENNFLNFSSLQYGTYKLEIMAKSQNTDWGNSSYLIFHVKPRFTETIWFNIGLGSVFIFASLLLVAWRYRIKNKKVSEQLELTERINELKHEALSAMMNPHFIFNSLNSVQYLVNCKKYEEANEYIAMMAKLMRKNLDTAGSGFILLSEEINKLKLYLDLEKLRFQESFTYEINMRNDVDADFLMIPNMIIQPFVENSLWHGILNSGKKGILSISFTFEDVEIDSGIYKTLMIKVTDNGIGIKQAAKNKKADHISKGIQIIEERLKLISEKMQLPQPIMFEDLSTRDENSQGTEIIISLPPPLYKIIT